MTTCHEYWIHGFAEIKLQRKIPTKGLLITAVSIREIALIFCWVSITRWFDVIPNIHTNAFTHTRNWRFGFVETCYRYQLRRRIPTDQNIRCASRCLATLDASSERVQTRSIIGKSAGSTHRIHYDLLDRTAFCLLIVFSWSDTCQKWRHTPHRIILEEMIQIEWIAQTDRSHCDTRLFTSRGIRSRIAE